MKKLLITGGAGFIGSNLSHHFLRKGWNVTIYDNLKRKGTKANLEWIKEGHPNVRFILGDIKDAKSVQNAVVGHDVIFHLAGQVAVTSSVLDPRSDFEANALGTLNVLEGARVAGHKPFIIYTSTNKVYGGMENIGVTAKSSRYMYKDYPDGISEKMNLDFHSPYGCSKGVGDQYVRDYYRIYGIPTVVLRQTCIYGPRQFGVEDQGWIAWFIIALSLGKEITICGDGKQVRDVLYIDDLVQLFEQVYLKRDITKGKIYNVGGGIHNTLSVWTEFGPLLEKLFKMKISPNYQPWRPGDQKVYVSDIRLVEKEIGWKPKVSVPEGVEKLFTWVTQNKNLFKKYFS